MSIAAGDDSDRLDSDLRLEREQSHLLLLDDAKRGLADVAAGRVQDADAALARLQPSWPIPTHRHKGTTR